MAMQQKQQQQPPPLPPPFNIPKITQCSSPSISGKRLFLEPEVIEVPPPLVSRRVKQAKHKQVIIHEVIDVEKDEDSTYPMILDKEVSVGNRGKTTKDSSLGNSKPKENMPYHPFIGSGNSAPASSIKEENSALASHLILGGCHSDKLYNSNKESATFCDVIDVDEYATVQVHFDNLDFPPGVETPIPWFDTWNTANAHQFHNTRNPKPLVSLSSDSSSLSKKPIPMSSSTFQLGMDSFSHASNANLSTSRSFHPVTSQHGGVPPTLPPWECKSMSISSSSTNYSSSDQASRVTLPQPMYWGHHASLNLLNQGGSSKLFFPSTVAKAFEGDDAPIGLQLAQFKSKLNSSLNKHRSYSSPYDPFLHKYAPPKEGLARTSKNVNKQDILEKFKLFKCFGTVEDHSDHHFTFKGPSTSQPTKNWLKRIQEEWRSLEKDLPDGIFVRVYETRMELLRAVIVGAEGTPYHDGLFFFDFFFPRSYPNKPPDVHYHSGGLRLNPNLYHCGKVCLSLLGTWHGGENERWLPGVSTILQVLLSIQALILNQKPYFNEPGYQYMCGSLDGEKRSQQYNESTFILSLKTMIYTMQRPPKNFEDFVLGHFHKRACDILVACHAYMDGAQVGCLGKGGVQDVDEGDKSCSKGFRDSLHSYVDALVREFSQIGIKDCKFQEASILRNGAKRQYISKKLKSNA